ncbi:sensor histidine kinase [Arenibaculum pallidiluteum]|uniref:sensor histidine kinase n=1 Tax=Arenibaculum pallidiluteum TaxID=2812559 RepID=UPI001A97B0AD|nr:PAS domain S-box protein [Arenibaculum pallidiluteum]
MTSLEDLQLSLAGLDEVEAGILVLDTAYEVVHWNSCLERLSGISSREVVGVRLWDLFPEMAGSQFRRAVDEALSSGVPSLLSHALHPALFPLRHRDGRPLLHDVITRRFHGHPEPLCFVQIKDATERRHLQMALDHSRLQYRSVFEGAAVGICELTRDGEYIRANEHFCAMLGYNATELLGRRFQEFTHPDDVKVSLELVRGLFSNETPNFRVEKRYVRKDGSVIWACVTGSKTKAAMPGTETAVAVIEDISERKALEAERQLLLEQKDLLVREVHHRVKNSLALVASLLSMQNRQIEDPRARAHIAAAHRRVAAIAQVHDRLHRGSQMNRVALGPFITDLCVDLEGMVMAVEGGQQVVSQIDVDLELSIDQALPIAMIVSELVGNAFKHAQPHGLPGRVDVVCRLDAGALKLNIRDNGVGLPEGFDPSGGHGLGMLIVTRLTQQLQGRLEARNLPSGAEFSFTFEPGRWGRHHPDLPG